MDPICHDYDKLSVKILSYLWLVINASLFSIFPPFISHFERGHLYLLKRGQALNSLSFGCKFVNSKYQTPKNCKFEL